MALNSNISSYLNRFVEYSNPQYAVMLTGDWGSGKTHFINEWIENTKKIEGKKYKPMYISLYGMQSISELRNNINRQLHPILTSAFVKGMKKVANGFAKTLIKCDFGEEGNPVEVSYELDLLPLFQTDNKEIQASGKILVFDDLERCHINRIELLGFINFFVEHCGCKVILLCNEEKMTLPSDSRTYKKIDKTEDTPEHWRNDAVDESIKDREYVEFKEKSVGATFEIKTDIEDAISSFISEIASDPKELITKMKPFLVQMLNATNNKNMRIVRQCLFDFDSIVKQIPLVSYQHEAYVPIMRKLLLDMLIVQMEVKAGNKLFDEPDSLVYRFLPGKKSESFSSLVQLYADVPNKLGIEILDYDNTKKIVNYIKTGYYPVNDIIKILSRPKDERQPWEKLTYFWKITNEEFEENYKLTAAKLKKRDISSLDELINIAFRLVNFEHLGIQSTSKTFHRDVMFCYGKLVKKLDTLEKVITFRQELIARLRYYSFEEKVEKWASIVTEMQNALDELIDKNKSAMTMVLENLSSATLPKLRELMFTQNPIDGRDYTCSPMFLAPNPKKVVKGITSLSNDELSSLREIISYHYQDLNISNYNDFKFYEPERENVKIIVEQLKRRRLSSVDKYAVNMVIREFEKFLNYEIVRD